MELLPIFALAACLLQYSLATGVDCLTVGLSRRRPGVSRCFSVRVGLFDICQAQTFARFELLHCEVLEQLVQRLVRRVGDAMSLTPGVMLAHDFLHGVAERNQLDRSCVRFVLRGTPF